MHERYTHLIDYIRNVVYEFSAGATKSIHGISSAITMRTIEFTGGAYSKRTPFGETDAPITVRLEVDPTKHSHSISTISDGVSPQPDTIAVRNGSGNIYSAGTAYGNSGYILANNKDISTLFIQKGQSNFTIAHRDVNSSSGKNVITEVNLTKSGNVFTLARTYGWVCNCNTTPYCNCCD